MDLHDKLVRMWRVAEYNHEVVGEAIDRLEELVAERDFLASTTAQGINLALQQSCTELKAEVQGLRELVHFAYIEGRMDGSQWEKAEPADRKDCDHWDNSNARKELERK